MTNVLTVKNFRSIKDAEIELGIFTVLNGENNSGKSSFLYALQVMKNIVSNPNQTVDELLNLHFLNLGGINETVFQKQNDKEIRLSLHNSLHYYEIMVSSKRGKLSIEGYTPFEGKGALDITFPYALNKKIDIEIIKVVRAYKIKWNGISPEYNQYSYPSEITTIFEAFIALLNGTDVTPTQRGFTKPIYNLIPLQQFIYTEDEVATLLATDKIIQSKVAYYFEKITGKRFAVSMSPGVGFFYLQVREPDSDFSTELVNQGMGINQIVYLLVKILYDKNTLICVDEPEIHLHPVLIEKFVHVLVEIAQKEGKRFLFSTHSEHLLLSLLAEVHEGQLDANDLKVHYLIKEGQETKVETQKVESNGQVAGGLKNFLASQMHLSQRFFPVDILG